MPYYYHSTQQYTTLTYSLDEYFLSSSLSLRFRENGPVRNVVIIMLKTLHITQTYMVSFFSFYSLYYMLSNCTICIYSCSHIPTCTSSRKREKVLRFFSYHEPYTRKPHLEDNNNNNNSLWKQEQARWWIKCCRHYNTRTDQTISSFLYHYQVLSLHTPPSSHESSAQTKEKLNFIPLCKTATSIPPQQPHTAS